MLIITELECEGKMALESSRIEQEVNVWLRTSALVKEKKSVMPLEDTRRGKEREREEKTSWYLFLQNDRKSLRNDHCIL